MISPHRLHVFNCFFISSVTGMFTSHFMHWRFIHQVYFHSTLLLIILIYFLSTSESVKKHSCDSCISGDSQLQKANEVKWKESTTLSNVIYYIQHKLLLLPINLFHGDGSISVNTSAYDTNMVTCEWTKNMHDTYEEIQFGQNAFITVRC